MLKKWLNFLGIDTSDYVEEIKTFIFVTFGAALYAATITLFVVPAKLPSAGVTGIAVFLNYQFGLPISIVAWLLNLCLFLYAYKYLPRRFLTWTIYSTITMSVALELTKFLPVPQIDDQLLLVLVAGVLSGLSVVMTMAVGASTGGTDILSTAIKSKTGIEIGNLAMAFNFAVIALFVPILSFQNILYGLVMVYVSSSVINTDLRAVGIRKEALIISSKPEDVKHYIMNDLHRGITVFKAAGGYSNVEREVIVTLLTTRQAAILKQFLKKHDPDALLRLSEATEVLGRGFNNWQKHI